jgi:hypothetical protein
MGDVALREEGERGGADFLPRKMAQGRWLPPGAKEWSLKEARRTPSRCPRSPRGIALVLALLDHAGECAGPAGLGVASPP